MRSIEDFEKHICYHTINVIFKKKEEKRSQVSYDLKTVHLHEQ